MSRLVILVIFSFALVAVGCKKVSSRQDLDKIRQLEKEADMNRELFSKGRESLNKVLLGDLGNAYLEFAEKYPEAPQTPDFLFRAGELYSNELKDLQQALSAFEKNYQKYPKHETAPNALFFTGYLYHNNLKDLIQAEKAYRNFLAVYPKHDLAPHAEFELKSLGIPADRIFDQIIKDAQKNPDDSVMNLPQKGVKPGKGTPLEKKSLQESSKN